MKKEYQYKKNDCLAKPLSMDELGKIMEGLALLSNESIYCCMGDWWPEDAGTGTHRLYYKIEEVLDLVKDLMFTEEQDRADYINFCEAEKRKVRK